MASAYTLDGPGRRLKPIATWCGATGSCPTIYLTECGTIVVQGYTVDSRVTGITDNHDQAMVEIPAELLRLASAA